MPWTAALFAFLGNTLVRRALARRLAASLDRHQRRSFRRALRRERQHLLQADHDLVVDAPARWHRDLTASVLAAHVALCSVGVPRSESLGRVEKALVDAVTSQTGYIRRSLDRSRDAFSMLVGISRKKEVDYYGGAFRFERARDDESSYDLRVHTCFFAAYFARHGAPELASAFCEMDRAWTDAIDQQTHGVRFTRPTTLARDGVPCRFLFERTPPA